MTRSASASYGSIVGLGLIVMIDDGAEIAMDAEQQLDQCLLLVLAQAAEQPPLARERHPSMTSSWVARPLVVSEIEWLRPSSGSVLMETRSRFCSNARVRLTGPLSKPITWQMRAAGIPGSSASERQDPPLGDVDAENGSDNMSSHCATACWR